VKAYIWPKVETVMDTLQSKSKIQTETTDDIKKSTANRLVATNASKNVVNSE
jgi:hypothetical protein